MPEQSFSYDDYLAALPAERRDAAARVWQIVRAHVPAGYVEQVTPARLTFAGDGEMYVALASMKNYLSLHLMALYVAPELRAKLDASGKKIKAGKSCINFTRADDLPLDALGEIVAAHTPSEYTARLRRLHAKA